MMHLDYPRKKGFLYWDEIGCLSRALGFHENLFVNNLPNELKEGKDGLSVEEFYDLFDSYKYFNSALDRSFNIHTDEWNIHNIKKSVMYIQQRIFTFEEIQDIRRAYEVYESSDTRGLRMDEKIVQRAIKMCGRMISPQKMMHRIKHMALRSEEPDRIQLHEFMELLLWCEMYKGIEVKAEDLNVSKDQRDLFELESFEELLSHYDQRLAGDLNTQYKKDELRLVKEKFSKKQMPKDIPPVDQEIRKRQVRYHSSRYKGLHRQLGQSTTRVNNSRAGYVRDRPVSAPDLSQYGRIDSSIALSALSGRPTTVMDMFGSIIRPKSAALSSESECTYSRPHTAEQKRPTTASTVEPSEVLEAECKIASLRYDMETIDRKYQEILEEDMDFVLPGYRQKLANRPKPAPPPPSPPPPKEPRPSEETLRRLSSPRRNSKPLPSHAKTCDARFRGWHKLQTSRGSHHYILASPSFDSSPNGRLLLRLQQTASDELKREPAIYRYTPRQNDPNRTPRQQSTTPRSSRPHTSPAVMVKAKSKRSRSRSSQQEKQPKTEDLSTEDQARKEGTTEGTGEEKKPFQSREETCTSINDQGAQQGSVGGVGEEKRNTQEKSCPAVEVTHEESDDSSVVSWRDLGIYQNKENWKENKIDKLLEGQDGSSDKNNNRDNSAKYGKLRVLHDIAEADDEGNFVKSRVEAPQIQDNRVLGEVNENSQQATEDEKCKEETAEVIKGTHEKDKYKENGITAKQNTSGHVPRLDLKFSLGHVSKAEQEKRLKIEQKQTDKNKAKGVESSGQYVDQWFTKSPKVAPYRWVGGIMHTDYSHRHRDKQLSFDFGRLAQRGVPDISVQLKQKLRKGITAV